MNDSLLGLELNCGVGAGDRLVVMELGVSLHELIMDARVSFPS